MRWSKFLLQRLHDAVLRMPDGYLTMVGERGLKVGTLFSVGKHLMCCVPSLYLADSKRLKTWLNY